jgi:phospholipase/carboxylesterase
MLEYIELPCIEKPRALMLWLHGLGADGYDLEPVADMLGIAGVRHVLPHAPVRPVTINGGMAMRAWYDIAGADLSWQEDSAGMMESATQVHELIAHVRGTTGLPVLLAGFSQGAVISLLAAGMGLNGLTGVAAMSGYVPQSLAPVPGALNGLPVFMAHGVQDGVIPFALAQQGRDTLLAEGVRMAWHAYDMQHGICQPEISALAVWVCELLGES